MKPLNPTLWRTCRVLAGANRLELLRQIFRDSEQCVSQLAKAVDIGEPYASQELRRLQSRGLLQRQRKGLPVFFRPIPDPQVHSAAPLLKALKIALAFPASRDEEILRIAKALANEQRIRIARELMNGPENAQRLSLVTRIRPGPLHRHLQLMIAGGFVRREARRLVWEPARHPLAQALAKLLR